MADNKSVSLVDFGRFFFAICVVGIHTHAFNDDPIIFSYVFSMAVPFFFVCSGFFLGKKISITNGTSEYRSILKKYWIRLLIPYLIWAPWYFCVEVLADHIVEHIPLVEGLKEHAIWWLVSGPGGALWYVQAILVLVPILMISGEKRYRYGIVALSIALSIVPSIVGNLDNPVADYVLHSRMFLWHGYYFLIGLFVGENWKKGFSKLMSASIFIAGLILLVVNFVTAWNVPIAHLFRLLAVVGLFSFLLSIAAPYSMDMSLRFRRYSTIIYFTHITLKYAVQMGFKVLHIPESTWVFVISVIIVIAYAWIVDTYFKETKLYKLLY